MWGNQKDLGTLGELAAGGKQATRIGALHEAEGCTPRTGQEGATATHVLPECLTLATSGLLSCLYLGLPELPAL